MYARVLLALVAGALAACSGSPSDNAAGITSEEVVAAFADAGLEAESPQRMSPNEFGVAPVVTDDATRFLIPSLGEDSGGRAFVVDNLDDLRKLKAAYDELGESSGLLFSWTFANEDRGVLVQINGELPEAEANRYAEIVDGL